MSVLLVVLALGLVASGAAAIFVGFDILLGDRGLPMIVVGAAVMSTGFVLVGLAIVARAIRRMERRLLADRRWAEEQDDVETVATGRAMASTATPAPSAYGLRPGFDETPPLDHAAPLAAPEPLSAEEMPRLPLPEPPIAEPAVAPAPQAPSVVGRYRSGGNAYVMFTDGSIEADTPAGRHRFSSLDELRAFVAAGGEKGEPS